MKTVVAAFNQEKASVGAFSVITNLWMELFEALGGTRDPGQGCECFERWGRTNNGAQLGVDTGTGPSTCPAPAHQQSIK